MFTRSWISDFEEIEDYLQLMATTLLLMLMRANAALQVTQMQDEDKEDNDIEPIVAFVKGSRE